MNPTYGPPNCGRDSPGLPFADADVESVLARRADDPQRRRLRDDGDLRGIARRRGHRVVVFDHSEKVRRLHRDAERPFGGGAKRNGIDAPIRSPSDLDDLDPEVLDVGPNRLRVVRMNRFRQDDPVLSLRHPLGEQHRLAERGGAVVERRVGDVEPGQEALVRLVLEDRLQRPLRDLGLVGRVGGEELGAEEELIDAGRLIVGIGAAAQERGVARGGDVARRQSPGTTLRISTSDHGPGRSSNAFRLTSSGMLSKRRSISLTPITASISRMSSPALGM